MSNKIAQYVLLLGCMLCAVACTTVSPVTGNTSMTDVDITTNVQTRLIVDPGLRYQNINVYTYERVVTLTGTVDNVSQATIAICLARSVPRVKMVISKLQQKCTDCI